MEPQEDLAQVSGAADFERRRSHPWIKKGLVTLVVVTVALVAGFNVVYAGKIYPGVQVDGVYLGGMSRSDAIRAVNRRLAAYQLETIPVEYQNVSVRILPFKLGLEYNVESAVDLAMQQGRGGGWVQGLKGQLRAIVGRTINIAVYNFDDDKLTPYLDQLSEAVVQPVRDAVFNVSGNSVTVNAGTDGVRLDRGSLVLALKDRLGGTSADSITAPVSQIQPIIDTAGLESVRNQAATYLSNPLTLTAAGQSFTVDAGTIVGWMNISRPLAKRFEQTHNIVDFTPTALPVQLTLDGDKVKAYVATLASKVDQAPANAQLSIQDNRATVFKPSRNGVALDQPATVDSIKSALQHESARQLLLSVKTTKPDVTEDNLNDLGIKELISEGQTSFTHSTLDRITNVRVGASKFNGVLIKPGEAFSFNTILGDVSAEAGYTAQPVILADHVENQFGGGLCQVSSTAFRAALNAGLPITARANHSFAVDYYTAPFGVPGVDATIYLPAPDFKFINDTGSYILIQTILDVPNRTLKFDFFGTKAKTGEIRGPFFVTGTVDATKPSHTVFYRDIKDLTGKVTKTDTFHSYYQASTDFPVVKQFGN